MTTEEVKKAIESKINEIDNLKKELTEIVFENPNVIENDENYTGTNGYIGGFKVVTDKKILRFAVNNNGWLTTFDNYLIGVTEMPFIKSFIIAKENEKLKNKIYELEKHIAELKKGAE